MNREEITNKIKQSSSRNILCELPTGFGKTKIAIEKSKTIIDKNDSLLIVINRNVHENTWREEFSKWWIDYNPLKLKFTTYTSFHKHKGNYKCVIFDECHHLSDRCIDVLCEYNIEHSILLSATVTYDQKRKLKTVFPDLEIINFSLRNAISNEILPEPKVYLNPITLDDTKRDVTIEITKKSGTLDNVCLYPERFTYLKSPNTKKLTIFCTQKEYIEYINERIEYFKNQYMLNGIQPMKFKWLAACSDRLKHLAKFKDKYIKNMMRSLKDERSLIFCADIAQTEALCPNCISSKNKESKIILDRFNNGEINQISACNILNEGVNLNNCRIGVYASLNSSDIMIIQKQGRLLRHHSPIIIIPYFEGTREEEIVYNKMLVNYDSKYVSKINSIKEIEL